MELASTGLATGTRRARIHIFGASGSGVSSLGRAIATRYSLAYFDADDFYWAPTDPPYHQPREREERRRLLLEALTVTPRWVLAGSIAGWGDIAIGLFDLAVFVTAPTDVRLRRLRAREEARFGDRLLENGDMHQNHERFMAWAAQYDEGSTEMRSRVWL